MKTGTMVGKYPAFVAAYDPQTRLCRVEIPGVTDGADVFPEADFEYPIGDKSEHTEIRILVGDRVWIEFEAGDPRYPIITGYRPKRVGNEVGTRRWHHANIETDADQSQVHTAGTSYAISVGGTTVVIEPSRVTITATAEVAIVAPVTAIDGDVTVSGDVTVQGDVRAGPISLRTHRTSLVQSGNGTGGPPVP